MELNLKTTFSILLPLALFIVIKLFTSTKSSTKNGKLPPSPPALPVIGHLHLLKKPLHHTLARISRQYGPITFLRFGERPVLLVSSRALAEQCFTVHDVAFANRVQLPSVKRPTFNYAVIAVANYGPYWRNARRIIAADVLSAPRILGSLAVRVEEARATAGALFRSWKKEAALTTGDEEKHFARTELKSRLFEISLNVMTRLIAGKRACYAEDEESEGSEVVKRFRETIEEGFKLSGASNLSDYLPLLRLLDFQGVQKRMNELGERMSDMTQRLIDEIRKEMEEGEETSKSCMIGHLLSLQKTDPENYSDEIIKAISTVSRCFLI